MLDFGLAKVTSEGQRRRRPDPRGPDARHARLHRARADPRRPVGRHPRRHLQPGLHALLPPERRPAVPWRQPLRHPTRPTTRWTPTPLNLVAPGGAGGAGGAGGQDDGQGAGTAVPGAEEVAQALKPFFKSGTCVIDGLEAGRLAGDIPDEPPGAVVEAAGRTEPATGKSAATARREGQRRQRNRNRYSRISSISARRSLSTTRCWTHYTPRPDRR